MKPLKGRFPFRVGTTSYIEPDAVLPNVRFLAPLVDDVELLLFEAEAPSLTPAEIAELGQLAARHGLTYTVHLPLDANLGAAEEAERNRATAAAGRAIALTRPLDPFAFVVHLCGEQKGPAPAADVNAWLANLEASVRALLAAGVPARRLCVETLAYAFEHVAPLVERLDLSVCLDIGHLLLSGFPPAEHVRRYWDRTRVVHLHGVQDGRDHRDISRLAPETLSLLWSHLRTAGAAERVVTLEVFNRADFERSLGVLAALEER